MPNDCQTPVNILHCGEATKQNTYNIYTGRLKHMMLFWLDLNIFMKFKIHFYVKYILS